MRSLLATLYFVPFVVGLAFVAANAQTRTDSYTTSGVALQNAVFQPNLDDGGVSLTACGTVTSDDAGVSSYQCQTFNPRTNAQQTAAGNCADLGVRVLWRGLRVGDAGL